MTSRGHCDILCKRLNLILLFMTNSGKITRANKSEVAPPSVNKMLSKEQGEVEMLQSMSSCHILLKKMPQNNFLYIIDHHNPEDGYDHS